LLLAVLVALVGYRTWSRSDERTVPSIVGPSRLHVGEAGVFTVEAGGDSERIEWFVDGTATEQGGELLVTPLQPGTMELEVVVAGEENDVGSGSVEIEVDAADDLELEPDEPEVAIEGPARIRLGEEATYTATVPEGTPIFWIDGDGRRHRTPDLVLTPSRAGVTTFRLSAKIDGRFHIVTRTVTVVDG
jgi:hypothetical protein